MPEDDLYKLIKGRMYLKILKKQEDDCESFTHSNLDDLFFDASKRVDKISIGISFLDRVGTCHWECAGGDHFLERMIARATGLSRASLRLLGMGFYDESLLLIRSLCEIVNLLALFDADSNAIDRWRSCDGQQAWKNFGPAKVCIALENLGMLIPVTEIHYKLLSETSAHTPPNHRPQAHNRYKTPTTGGHFQARGFDLCANELGLAIANILLFTTSLILKEEKVILEVKRAAQKIYDSLGSINLCNMYIFREDLERMDDP